VLVAEVVAVAHREVVVDGRAGGRGGSPPLTIRMTEGWGSRGTPLPSGKEDFT
jgi:hypothetical protein